MLVRRDNTGPAIVPDDVVPLWLTPTVSLGPVVAPTFGLVPGV